MLRDTDCLFVNCNFIYSIRTLMSLNFNVSLQYTVKKLCIFTDKKTVEFNSNITF